MFELFGAGGNINMNFLDYRKSLGIAINDENKIKFFFVKIFNVLHSIDGDGDMLLDDGEYFTFCNTAGVQMYSGELYGQGYSYIIKELQSHTSSLEEFLPYYMAFVNCIKNIDYRNYNSDSFYNLVCSMLKESQIPYEMRKDEDGYFIFPCGAKELDDALVSQNLEWLKAYPQARKSFIKAIKDYSNQNKMNASNIADNFRKSLETFFQEFFKSEKSLENYKSEYGAYLKSHEVPAEISNNLESLLQAYTNYINSYVKHHDKTSTNILEYIMYQTGNIIRLLITLEKN